jgi:hypothetical protein
VGRGWGRGQRGYDISPPTSVVSLFYLILLFRNGWMGADVVLLCSLLPKRRLKGGGEEWATHPIPILQQATEDVTSQRELCGGEGEGDALDVWGKAGEACSC